MEEKKKRKNPKRLACIIKCIHGKKKRENKYDRVTEKRSKTLLVLGAENTATKENRKTVAPLEGLGGPGRAAVRRIRGGPRPRGFSDVFRSVAAAAHCRGVFVRRNRDGARVQRIPPPSGHDDNNSTGGLVVNIIYSFFSEISFFFFLSSPSDHPSSRTRPRPSDRERPIRIFGQSLLYPSRFRCPRRGAL